ncbi:UNVERIFIED_CONTAM: Fatty-acid amide hydrolase 2 [Trichonephila clavipes]
MICVFLPEIDMPLLLGLVSNLGTHPIPEPTLIPYISTGPMCRYAEDLIISMRVLSSQSGIPVDFGQMVDFKNLKIYYMKEIRSPMIAPVDSDIALALKSVSILYILIHFPMFLLLFLLPSLNDRKYTISFYILIKQ